MPGVRWGRMINIRFIFEVFTGWLRFYGTTLFGYHLEKNLNSRRTCARKEKDCLLLAIFRTSPSIKEGCGTPSPYFA